MAHLDIELPRQIKYGAVFGHSFSTEIVTVNSGAESRNGLWENAKITAEIEYIKGEDSKDLLVQFFRGVKGSLHSFNIRDWSDYKVSASTGVLLSAAGTPGLDGGATAKLGKLYTAGTETEYRPIGKPELATLYKAGAAQSAGYTLNVSTGVITWAATSSKAAAATVGATTSFAATAHGFTSGKVVSFSGFGGTLGSALNGKGFAVTVTGANAFTIALDSTGLTGGNGNVVTYPVAGENWSWAGTFFVPVRFTTDKLEIVVSEGMIYEVSGLQLVEVRL